MARRMTRSDVGLRQVVLAVAVSALAACVDSPSGPPQDPNTRSAPQLGVTAEVIPGQYIVVFRDDVVNAQGRAAQLVAAHGGTLRHTYTAALKGFAAKLSDQAVARLRRDPTVAYVEQDQIAHAVTTQSNATWGLDRIDQRNLPLSTTYTYTATGTGVYAYIIDTGLRATHTEFGTRASNVYDAFGGTGNDCNGHGTHVGGTVGGRTYGVAKNVQLRGVRVLNCAGSGSYSGVIAGVDWVRQNRVNPAVANLSLGGPKSTALNTAVSNLANSGVFVAVAAGNENQNACNVSPASAGAAFTTAASTSSDAKASFSNWGSCVDAYAPGASIKSAWHTSNTATNTISGTSMASPHVAGVAALYKHANGNASTSTITNWIKTNATPNKITGNVTGTPNKLLFKNTL